MQSEHNLSANWRERLLQALAALLRPDEDVVAVGVRGSLIEPELLDVWSDVDLALVVRDDALARFFPTLDWLAPLGEIFAYEQFEHADHWTTRICFEDFRRLDVTITTETVLLGSGQQPLTFFPGPTAVLFSRSGAVTAVLERESPPPVVPEISPESWQRMGDNFWFKAVVATTKAARNDLLIALHLALELLQECCVLGMMLRDRATGTPHHKSGGMGNRIVAELPAVEQSYTPLNILDLIEKSGAAFDQLAQAWADDYQAKHQLLAGYVDRARQSLGSERRS